MDNVQTTEGDIRTSWPGSSVVCTVPLQSFHAKNAHRTLCILFFSAGVDDKRYLVLVTLSTKKKLISGGVGAIALS